MLNLFISYHCNLACDYCFVQGFQKFYPQEVSEDDFERLCQWLQHTNVATIGILGGEPTINPRLPQMLSRLRASGVSPVLFTNALYRDEGLTTTLANHTINVVVNYNNPAQYSQAHQELRARNLKALVKSGASLSFSKNFCKDDSSFEYLIQACLDYGVTRIRYDISRPAPAGGNNHFDLGETSELASQIVRFVHLCDEHGILTGLDCCQPLCDFNTNEQDFLKAHSMKFAGICHPSMDIQTDLSVTYCIPLRDVHLADVTRYAGEWELLLEFNTMVRELRAEHPLLCEECERFGLQCQGGCLALKRHRLHAQEVPLWH